MSASPSNPLLHRWAQLTVCVALVTLTAGALVTSKNAGMAFRDWPTSDGQNMLLYPWLRDFAADWDKFLEHGHRLAGMLIGLWSIALCGIAWATEKRRWVALLATGVLVGVIIQGILGGFRVWLDERGLAMVHGMFAAIVFSLMGAVVCVTGRRWEDWGREERTASVGLVKPMAVAVIVALLLQYTLGGLIRHRGTGLHEHVGLGVLLFVSLLVNALVCLRSDVTWLRRSGVVLFGIAMVQVALGVGAWVYRFGFAPTGFVATADSITQVTFRTAHTVVGILLFMWAATHLLRVMRVSHGSAEADLYGESMVLREGVAQ